MRVDGFEGTEAAHDVSAKRHRAAVEAMADEIRLQLAMDEARLRALKEALLLHSKYATGEEYTHRGEAIAQAMLALRHVEDARMRVGKVIQYALQGGIPYGVLRNPPETPGTEPPEAA